MFTFPTKHCNHVDIVKGIAATLRKHPQCRMNYVYPAQVDVHGRYYQGYRICGLGGRSLHWQRKEARRLLVSLPSVLARRGPSSRPVSVGKVRRLEDFLYHRPQCLLGKEPCGLLFPYKSREGLQPYRENSAPSLLAISVLLVCSVEDAVHRSEYAC